MFSSGLFSGIVALLLAAFLGFLAAWVWRGKRMAFLLSQAARLRRDRRALSQRISQANARLDSANFKRAETDETLSALRAAHEKLEEEHARLVASYTNLKQGIVGLADDDDWFDGLDDEEPSEADVQARDAALRELEAFEEQLTSTSEAMIRDLPLADSPTGADSASVASTGLASPASEGEPGNANDHDDHDDRGVVAAAAGQAAMREQLESQQAEITRLQEQMAPLIGLPLAVAAREAERDRLAARLQARDREVTDLQAAVEQLSARENQLQQELDALRDPVPPTSSGVSAPSVQPAADGAMIGAVPGEASDGKPGSRDDGTAAEKAGDKPVAMLSGTDASSSTDLPPKKKKKKKKEQRNAEKKLRAADRSLLRDGPPGLDTDAPGYHNKPVADDDNQQPGSELSPPRQFDGAPNTIDNLKEIKGIGPVLEQRLNQLGVFQFRQIAAWKEQDIAYFDEHLAEFRGRIRRDDWVGGAAMAQQRKYG